MVLRHWRCAQKWLGSTMAFDETKYWWHLVYFTIWMWWDDNPRWDSFGLLPASATLFSNGHGHSPCKGLSSSQASLNQLSFPFFSFTRKGCSDLSSSVISPVMPLIPTCERLEKPLREAIYTAVFINKKLSKPMGWFIWEMICKCWIFHIYVLGSCFHIYDTGG